MTSTNWPPNITIETLLARNTALSIDRQTQAIHDAEVVREILAGCRLEQQRMRRYALRARVTVLLKALGKASA